MRRTDEPIDPDILAELDAIDATLAGEPVDPQHAELAELALLLADIRPRPEPAYAVALDQRVQRRFVAPPAASRPRRRWLAPLAGLTAAAVAGLVVLVVVAPGSGSGGSEAFSTTAASSASQGSAAASAASNIGQSPSVKQRQPPTIALDSEGKATSTPSASASAANANSVPYASASGSLAPRPPSNGRKIVQSANLALRAPPAHIEDVAQQVFNVIGRENGVVRNSTVTAGTQGNAQFALSVPSGNLADTMTALSSLHYAQVASRTDVTQDVNNTYVSATRRLADDRALRTSLLKQLAGATTQQQIDSLNGRIHDAEAAIARDESALRSLNNKIDYSQIEVTVDSYVAPVAAHHSNTFTLGRAAHDAGRVLTVAAGVALVALAALVPLTLVVALALWIAAALRRRRREHALDLA